jgi:hypothetical protein
MWHVSGDIMNLYRRPSGGGWERKLYVNNTGATTITNLAGTGNRPVYADATGTLTVASGGSAAEGAATVVPLATFGGEPVINATSWQRVTRTTYSALASLLSAVPVTPGATRKYYLVIRRADNQPGGTGSLWRFACDGAWNSSNDVPGHGFSLGSNWGSTAEGTTDWIEIPPTAVSGSGCGTAYWKIDARMQNAGQTMRVMSVSLAAVDIIGGTNVAYSAATSGNATAPSLSWLYENAWSNGTNVGIGTTAPSAKFHVSGGVPSGIGGVPANTTQIIENGAADAYLTLRNRADLGNYTGIQFQDNNVGGYIAFRSYIGSGANDGTNGDYMLYGTYTDHIFQNGTSEAVNGKPETMRIKQNGNVGIGTTTPAYKLDVAGTTRSQGWAMIGTGADRLGLELQGSFHRMAFNELRFYDWDWGGDMVTFNQGNVGIGTTGPAEKIHSTGNIRADGIVFWGNSLTRTETRDNAGLQGNAGARSGFYETSAPTNYPAGASSWWHLLDVRHNNPANNYAMQIAGSFYDQNLWFRKTNGNGSQAWTRLLSTSDNGSFIQNQNSLVQSANFIISGTGRADGDFRAPIFYDQNNTAFFIDPNSNALLNKLRVDGNATTGGQWGHDPYGYGWGAPHGSFRSLEVSSSGNYSTEPAMFRIHQWGSGAAEFWKPQGTNLYLRETPGGGGGWFTRFIVQGKHLVHRGSIPNGWDQADWGATVSFRSPGTNVMGNASHGNAQLELVSDGPGTAHISFHRPGLFGANFGLDSDNWFSTQGWSAGGGYTSMRVGYMYAEGKGRFRRGGYGMGNGNEGQIEVSNAGNGEAFISFHREGAYGAHFGLGGDNWFSTYGWSAGGGWTAMRVGTFEARGGGRFYSSAYTRDWGDASGTSYGTIFANADNQFMGGIALSDDGGFYERNDGWIRFDGSVGIIMDGNNASSISFWDMNDNGGIHDKQLVTSNSGWGVVGTSGNYWYYMYSGAYYTPSRRELKRDITPITGNLSDYVMDDLDKIKPSFYKFNEDQDDWVEGNETKFRPNLRMGLILDETPDYLQDQTFGGIDLYSLTTLAVLGAKNNRQEIKELQKAMGLNANTRNVQDFGSATFTGKEFFVAFNNEFAEQLGAAIPMVTVTSYNPDVTLSLKEKSSKGFTVVSSVKVNSPVAFDYIAMAKVPSVNTQNVDNTQPVSSELMSGLKVDQATKDKIHQYWEKNKQYYDDLREGRLDNTVLPESPQK